MSDTNRIKLNKLFLSYIGIFIGIIFLNTSFSVAGEYVSLTIDPIKLGMFYQNKTAQFHAYGTTASGAMVDITSEVDWYIDPAGYPANSEQVLTEGAVATINTDTGKVTLAENVSWGRVVVYACYPKGCYSNPLKPISSAFNSLLLKNVPTYTVTSSAIGSGTVAPEGPNIFKEGKAVVFTLTPVSGNQVLPGNITDDCGSAGAGTLSVDGLTYTTEPISGPCSVEFEFTAIPTHLVTSSATGDGTVSPDGENPFYEGQPAVFTLTPVTGNLVLPENITDDCGVSGAGVLSANGLSYTTENIDSACSVSFEFTAVPTHTVTSSATGGGTVSLDGANQFNEGQPAVFTLTPGPGNQILPENITDDCGVSGNGVLVGLEYTTEVIDGTCSVSFAFTALPVNHTVTSSATNGTVTPNGATQVSDGQQVDFTLGAASGYQILPENITDGCGVSGNGNLSVDGLTYTTEVIDGPCSVDFTFTFIPTTLAVGTAGAGAGTGGVYSNPVGTIACGFEGTLAALTDCSETYDSPTQVTINVIYSGSFTGWTAGTEGCTPVPPDTLSDESITVSMTSDQTCVANFGN